MNSLEQNRFHISRTRKEQEQAKKDGNAGITRLLNDELELFLRIARASAKCVLLSPPGLVSFFRAPDSSATTSSGIAYLDHKIVYELIDESYLNFIRM